MNRLIIYALVNHFIKFISGSNSNCSEKHCLYTLDNYLHDLDGIPDNYCSQNGSRNGWLLEIYDENVQSLVDQFVKINNLRGRNSLLGASRLPVAMTWINKASFYRPTDIVEDLYENTMVYITTASASTDKQTAVTYVKHDARFQLQVLCSIKCEFIT
ncbi:hypothetical protein HELRODRAFT_183942 [Helobdella robusta]|uniref:Uncharacterized protein n=1 Tax=Helobdella robusta TaxID=6412 RepID=T1FKC0_HELRO|nr:hypothetical protein HELRODRAFT_183942 [Helobdella robusta]ESO09724.1 hypothetical protein HELRODRAFT_183942 [Helobdella robusta]